MKQYHKKLTALVMNHGIAKLGFLSNFGRYWGYTTIDGVEVLQDRNYFYPHDRIHDNPNFQKWLDLLGISDKIKNAEMKGVEEAWLYLAYKKEPIGIAVKDLISSKLPKWFWDPAYPDTTSDFTKYTLRKNDYIYCDLQINGLKDDFLYKKIDSTGTIDTLTITVDSKAKALDDLLTSTAITDLPTIVKNNIADVLKYYDISIVPRSIVTKSTDFTDTNLYAYPLTSDYSKVPTVDSTTNPYGPFNKLLYSQPISYMPEYIENSIQLLVNGSLRYGLDCISYRNSLNEIFRRSEYKPIYYRYEDDNGDFTTKATRYTYSTYTIPLTLDSKVASYYGYILNNNITKFSEIEQLKQKIAEYENTWQGGLSSKNKELLSKDTYGYTVAKHLLHINPIVELILKGVSLPDLLIPIGSWRYFSSYSRDGANVDTTIWYAASDGRTYLRKSYLFNTTISVETRVKTITSIINSDYKKKKASFWEKVGGFALFVAAVILSPFTGGGSLILWTALAISFASLVLLLSAAVAHYLGADDYVRGASEVYQTLAPLIQVAQIIAIVTPISTAISASSAATTTAESSGTAAVANTTSSAETVVSNSINSSVSNDIVQETINSTTHISSEMVFKLVKFTINYLTTRDLDSSKTEINKYKKINQEYLDELAKFKDIVAQINLAMVNPLKKDWSIYDSIYDAPYEPWTTKYHSGNIQATTIKAKWSSLD